MEALLDRLGRGYATETFVSATLTAYVHPRFYVAAAWPK